MKDKKLLPRKDTQKVNKHRIVTKIRLFGRAERDIL